jgi:hypothetical protein
MPWNTIEPERGTFSLGELDQELANASAAGMRLVLIFWYSGWGGSPAVVQADGNFVLYTSSGSPVWSTGTAGNTGASLVVRNSSDVVIYGASGSVLWSSGSNRG